MSAQFINDICVALDQTTCQDNNARSQAEDFLKKAQFQDQALSSVMQIIMQPEELSKINGGQLKCEQVYLQAVTLLKNQINERWEINDDSSLDKENVSQNVPQQLQPAPQISDQEKELVKANIFTALQNAQSKQISSQFENIIFNIAQTDFAKGKWQDSIQQIQARLVDESEQTQIIGLRALKELVRAFQYEVDSKRKVLLEIGHTFLPHLQSMMIKYIEKGFSDNQMKILILISKIFYMCNTMKLQPDLVVPGALKTWIDIFVSILDSDQDASSGLIQPTDKADQIEVLDKHDWWKLKGICSKISLKLYQKFRDDYQFLNARRCQDKKYNEVKDKRVVDQFVKEFQDNYIARLNQVHLKLLMLRQSQFVGTRTLALSIKFLTMSMRFKHTRELIKPHIENILFNISLPLFLTSEKDLITFESDPIEYVRLQVDHQNELNVKRQLSMLVDKMCSLRYGKRRDNCAPVHLKRYMETILGNLNEMKGADNATEALLYAFGNLREKCLWNNQPDMMQMMQAVIQNYAFPNLSSPSPLMVSRACWVYAKFGVFQFENDAEHLAAAVEKIVNNLYSHHIAVKVEAALAISELLDHQVVQEIIRPALGNVLKVFLKIMDEIDFEDLVGALRKIVDIYENDIAPYAVSLCQKLSEAYVRCVKNKGSNDDEDNEAGLTADGLMTAVRRVLNSISGKFPHLYPQLEEILEQSIYTTLSEPGHTHADEGLTVIAELIYNQNEVSQRMWGIYQHIISIYIQDHEWMRDLIGQASVPLINFMVKSPEVFKTANFQGQGTPLQMMFNFIQKIFHDGNAVLADEVHSMCAVTLLMAMLEHLGEGISESIHQINLFYISELTNAETSHYKNMLIQGIMMNFWYDQGTTIASLQSHGQLDNVFNFILSNIPQIQKDFEVKRVIIGLGALTLSDKSSSLDAQVQARFSDFINAIVLLCQKSIELRQKKIQKQQDEENEEAIEDQECEREAIFEEDDEDGIELGDDEDDYNDSEDNWDVEDEDELDNELYDTKIDKIDEILYIQEQIGVLQQKNDAILQIFTSEHQQYLGQFFSQAQAMNEQKQQAELLKQQQKEANQNTFVQQVDLS